MSCRIFTFSDYRIETSQGTRDSTPSKARKNPESNALKFFRSLSWIFFKRISTVFIKLKNIKPLEMSLAIVKPVQQLVLTIQKKAFTNKLWAYYKIKNLREPTSMSMTCFNRISTAPSMHNTAQQFRSTSKCRRRSTFLLDQKFSKVSKMIFIVNKQLQTSLLRTFWQIYTWEGQSVWDGPWRSQKEKAKEMLRILEKAKDKRVKTAFEMVKNAKGKTKSKVFLSYFIAPGSMRGMSMVINFVERKEKDHLRYGVKKILSKCKSIYKQYLAAKNIFTVLCIKQARIKHTCLSNISSYTYSMKIMKKINYFAYKISFLMKIRKAFGFFRIKSFSTNKATYSRKIVQILDKHYLLRASFSFVYIKKFANAKPTRRIYTQTRRQSPKLITLPTIFLRGDPGNVYEGSSYRQYTRKNHSLKFYK